MSEQTEVPTTSSLESSNSGYVSQFGREYRLLACSNCQGSYLTPVGVDPARCPVCSSAGLSVGSFQEDFQSDARPELVVPFQLTDAKLSGTVEAFAHGIPYPPQDLNAAKLKERMQPVFLPQWLVDARVQAQWQAEMGFNYQVVSHQEAYSQNSAEWNTREVKETRVRWEPRLGELAREYHNVRVPATEVEKDVRQKLGGYDEYPATAFIDAQMPDRIMLRLPDRDPQDAWSEATPELQKAAADECRKAGGGDYIRQFSWKPTYENVNWTMLLIPLFASYYLDDEGIPQPVLLHGVTGKVAGRRRASMRTAQDMTVKLLIIAAAIFFVGLLIGGIGLVAPPLLVVGAIALLVAIGVGLGALVPLIQVWRFNQ